MTTAFSRLAVLAVFMLAALWSTQAFALKFKLSVPEDHPDKIKTDNITDDGSKQDDQFGMPQLAGDDSGDDDQQDDEDAFATGDDSQDQDAATGADTDDSSSADSDDDSDDDAGSDDDGTAKASADSDQKVLKGDQKYNGLYEAWQPVKQVFPLKAANVELVSSHHRNDKGRQEILSNSLQIGNIYLEGDQADKIFKSLDWKVQFNRQPKLYNSSNSSIDFKGELGNSTLEFARKLKHKGDKSKPDSVNLTREQSFAYTYKPGASLTFKVQSNRQLSHTRSSDSPSATKGVKDNWSVNWLLRENTQLALSHVDNVSRDEITGGTNRNNTTDINLTMPLFNRLGVKVGYTRIDTKANKVDASQSANNKKNMGVLAFIYQLQENSQLTYTLKKSNNSNLSSTARTSFEETGRELDVAYKLSKIISFTGKNVINNNHTSGKLQNTTAALSIDHNGLKLLPGTTKISSGRNINRAGAGLVQTTNQTNAIAIPLSYMNKRLTVSVSSTDNLRNSYSPSAVSTTDSLQNVYSASYKFSFPVQITSQLKSVDSSTGGPSGVSSETSKRTLHNTIKYSRNNPFGKQSYVKSFQYVTLWSRSRATASAQDYTLTISKVRTNAGTFQLKSGVASGFYKLQHSLSTQPNDVKFRAIQHHINLNLDILKNYKTTMDYIAVFQTKGFSNSGSLKLSKEINDGNTLGVSYEFSKLQDTLNTAGNTRSHYFETSLELSF